MYAKVKEQILIYKKTYNDYNLLKIYKGIKYCKDKSAIKELAELLECVEIGDFNIANSIVHELNILVFGDEYRDLEIVDVIDECRTMVIGNEQQMDSLEELEMKPSNNCREDRECVNNSKLDDETEGKGVETEKQENNVENCMSSLSVIFEDLTGLETNENSFNKSSSSHENNGLAELFEITNEKEMNDRDYPPFIESTVSNIELCDKMPNVEENNYYDEYFYHTALSHIIKPLLFYKTKECVNMLIHLAHKTDTQVMHTLLKDYKENKHWCIEILLHIAQINKRQSKDYSEVMAEVKNMLTEMISTLFDRSIIDNNAQKKFVAQMILVYLGVETDQFLYDTLKRIISENDMQINIAICASLSKMVNGCNAENGSVVEVFDLLESHSNSIRYSLSVQFQFYRAFDCIPGSIFNKYLKWVYEAMSETIIDHIFCEHICLEAITNLFLIFCPQYKTREMYIIFFFIIAQKGDVLYKRCMTIITKNLTLIQKHLFDQKTSAKTNTEIDFNKLGINGEIERVTEKLHMLDLEDSVHDFEIYNKMMNCGGVHIKHDFSKLFNDFLLSYTGEASELIRIFIEEIDVLRLSDSETRKQIYDYLLNLQLMWREEKRCFEFLIKNENLFSDEDNKKYHTRFCKSKYFYVRMLVDKNIAKGNNTK